MLTHPKLPQSPLSGSSTFHDEENQEGHQKEDPLFAHHQDPHQEEVVEEVAEEVAEECSPLMAKHPKQPKSFLEMHLPSSQVTEPKSTPSSLNGNYIIYCNVNANNAAIQNQYQKTMLFLTYIQGDLVRVWVIAASQWLANNVMR